MPCHPLLHSLHPPPAPGAQSGIGPSDRTFRTLKMQSSPSQHFWALDFPAIPHPRHGSWSFLEARGPEYPVLPSRLPVGNRQRPRPDPGAAELYRGAQEAPEQTGEGRGAEKAAARRRDALGSREAGFEPPSLPGSPEPECSSPSPCMRDLSNPREIKAWIQSSSSASRESVQVALAGGPALPVTFTRSPQ